ncbi:MAG: APC family permease [Fimbriimonas sp.]
MKDVRSPNVFQRLRRALVGAPIPTRNAHHERLSPSVGLAVFSSDALSSVAYATEAVLSILVLMSAQALGLQLWISLAVVGLIAIISFSYRQTIKAYPHGGGSYIVASDNLGETAGVVAGAALLIDYVLTVAVSISAGVAALSSAFPVLHPYLVQLGILFTMMVAWANLRGMRESGGLFAVPTYGFVIAIFVTLVVGIWRTTTMPAVPQVVVAPGLLGTEANYPMLYIVLRAFAAGCTALTGIEAVSDGVQAFRPPEAKNAAKTLMRMAVILATLFLGMGYITTHLPTVSLRAAKDPEYITLAAQVAKYAFGAGNPLFFIVQFLTAAILILAANTAFADFPRLSSFLARDGYLPRYMARQGDRLVFHNGILVLAGAAMALIVIFHGELDQLLPLYAVGVFTAFSLSQSGMVAYWLKRKEEGWRHGLAVSSLGASLCIIVLLIILVTKFKEGAGIVAILLPAVCVVLLAINRRYRAMTKQLAVEEALTTETTGEHIVLLLLPRVHRGTLSALDYASQLQGECQAVHVTINERGLPDLQRKWQQYGRGIPLVVLASPYRSLIQPVLDYVDKLRVDRPGATITVVVAEAVSTKWYQKLLSENVAQQLKVSLARRKKVVVANVRYFLN